MLAFKKAVLFPCISSTLPKSIHCLHVHSSTPAAFCSAHVFHAMLPTSPLTAARILNFEQLPRACASKAVFGKGAEPQLLHIADLFLANRHPQSLSCLSREDPRSKTWLQQVGRNHNLPKIVSETHRRYASTSREFLSAFPLKHRRMTKSSMTLSCYISTVQVSRHLDRIL